MTKDSSMSTYVLRYFDKALKDRVKAAADRDGLSLRDGIVKALTAYADTFTVQIETGVGLPPKYCDPYRTSNRHLTDTKPGA